MKKLIQLSLFIALILILLDISSCSTSTEEVFSTHYSGQFIDLSTQKPVDDIKLQMNSSSGKVFQTNSNKSGAFEIALQDVEGQDYSLHVHDNRYKLVNPNQHVHTYENQIWYLLPSRYLE